MTDVRHKARDLKYQALALPHGQVKVTLLEEAVALADSVQDVDLAFELRDDLMTAATFANRPDVMIVAFSWCLAQFDRDPNRFDSYLLLWKYKWVVNNGRHFPDISRSQIESLFDDMQRRFREAGSTMNAVALIRRKLAVTFGDHEEALQADEELGKLPRDFLSDCAACVADSDVDYHCFERDWQCALDAAAPVLHGWLTCAEQPHSTLASVLLPLLRLGRIEDAKLHQAQGYRLVRSSPQFVEQHAQHLRFAAIVGEPAWGKRLLERHLPAALMSVTLDEKFQFLLAARLWTDRAAGRSKRAIKLRLPEDVPVANVDGKYDLSALGAWFTTEAQHIAQRFDARSGTKEFQRQIDELPELLALAVN